MKAILSPDFKMNLSMEHCAQAMAMEATTFETAIAAIKRYLPGLSNGFAEKAADFQASMATPIVDLPKELRKPIEVLRSVSYFDLEKMPVFVHEGFEGSLRDMVPVLQSLINHIGFVNELTTEYKGFLGAIITNRDSRISLNSHQKLYSKSHSNMTTLQHAIDEHYKKGSTLSELSFGNVFARNSDAEKFLQEISEVRRHLDKAPIETVRQNVGLCSEYLRLFIEGVEKGEIDDVSNEVIKDLSVGSYQIAKEAEFVAVNHFRINAFIATANRLIDSLNKHNPL